MKTRKFAISFASIALAISACSFYDNYDVDLMQDATASIETSSSNEALESSAKEESSSSKENVSSSSSTHNNEDTSSSSEKKEDSSSSAVSSSSAKEESSSSQEPTSASSSSEKGESSSSAGNTSSSSEDPPASSATESSSSDIASSNSDAESSSSSAPAFKCGEKFKDPRDGIEYSTIAIPNKSGQCWFAENLNHATAKSAYFNNDSLTYSKYGRLYQWTETQSACPEGSVLPDQSDWETLDTYLGNAVVAGKYLKSDSEWDNAEDAYGFTALPAGYYDAGEEEFLQQGSIAIFWGATESGTDAYARVLKNNTNNLDVREYPKTNMNSIRCLVK